MESGGKWFMISHGKKVARLHRPADQRKALLRNLTTDLLRYGRITTTMAIGTTLVALACVSHAFAFRVSLGSSSSVVPPPMSRAPCIKCIDLPWLWLYWLQW